MAVIFKPTSPAAMSVRPFAESLASSLPGKRGVKTRIMLGFLMRAVGDGKNVTVTVIEPGGFIGGAYGAIERAAPYYYPGTQGKVTALYKAAIAPISTLTHAGATAWGSLLWKSYALNGGVRLGGPAAWTPTHNILPSMAPKACVVPSAIMLPYVTGTVGTQYTNSLVDPPENRSVLIQRLNATTAWGDGPAAGTPAPASPYGLRLNPAIHTAAASEISHIEIAAAAFNLGVDELKQGNMACLEWGPLEGVVVFDALKPAVPSSGSITVASAAVAGDPVEGAYPIGHVLTRETGGVMNWNTLGSDSEPTLRCARYSIAAVDAVDDNGSPIKTYTPKLLWVVKLDGQGASGELAGDAPPAMTFGPEYERAGGMAPVAPKWSNLWRLQDALIWSANAGYVGGHARAGEQIIGIGTAIIRRFKSITKRTQILGPLTADDPYMPADLTVSSTPAIRTYHDRHTVRFAIDPATGAISYESLAKFENCYNTRPNDVSRHPGLLEEGYSISALGSDQLIAYDVDIGPLEGFTHKPLIGFTKVTPASDTAPEKRDPFIVCRRTRSLYDLMPEAQDNAAHPRVDGTPGGADYGPIWTGISPYKLLAGEGEVLLWERPTSHHAGWPASFPYRATRRNPTKEELIENEKVVVIGASGAEVVMQTGAYYPDFGGGPELPLRYEEEWPANASKREYAPDRIARGAPVCHYAPGIIAIVVIPNAQFPEPRAYWPWPPPYTTPMPIRPAGSGDLYSYSGAGYDAAAWQAWVDANNTARAIPAEPKLPASLKQDRYLALCDAATGALLAVSAKPIYSGTAKQDTTGAQHRRADVYLSCVEMGKVDPATGALTQHAVVLVSVREPPRYSLSNYPDNPTNISLTTDFGETMRGVITNDFAIAAHYLGSPIAPAQIGVSAGVAGLRGKAVSPPA